MPTRCKNRVPFKQTPPSLMMEERIFVLIFLEIQLPSVLIKKRIMELGKGRAWESVCIVGHWRFRHSSPSPLDFKESSRRRSSKRKRRGGKRGRKWTIRRRCTTTRRLDVEREKGDFSTRRIVKIRWRKAEGEEGGGVGAKETNERGEK